MKVTHLDDEGTEQLFKTMFVKRNLVPVLGAGFSKGGRTKQARVSDAEGFRQIMLSVLCHEVGEDANQLQRSPFAEIADCFLDSNFVATSTVKDIISKYFTNVSIGQDKKRFLNCPWPYVYTLNIDDAIERNSTFTNKVVPNRQVSNQSRQMNCVYKVHGDAVDELIYDEPSRIIFSTSQYVRSLTTNLSLLNSLKTDLTEQNTLFVGCSLTDEIDLLYALAEYDEQFPEGRASIYVTKETPNQFDTAKLGRHGINEVLIVEQYDSFYATVARWADETMADSDGRSHARLHHRPVQGLANDYRANLSFLLRDGDRTRLQGSVILPDYYVQRNIEAPILRAADNRPIILIRGRRFSGRTLLLRSLALSSRTRQVAVFDSETQVTQEELDIVFETSNGLFLFDSNSLSGESAYELARHRDALARNHSCAVVAVNRTEPYVHGALVRLLDDEDEFELPAWLSADECERVNKKFDALGLLRFEKRKTLLDNTFTILRNFSDIGSDLENPPALADLRNSEVEVLLVLSIADKAFSSLATALDLRTSALFELSEKLGPIVEVIDTSRTELRATNSRHKLVVNSRIGLALIIRHIVDLHGPDWISERINHVVLRLIAMPKLASVGHSMYMFDAINHILSQFVDPGESTGYRPVVLSLYERLQPALNDTADYWLQRAKASLRLEDSPRAILDGIGYATKAYREAERDRTMDNAEFTIALLYGKLCSVEQYHDADHVVSAIQWFSQAIDHYQYNQTYVARMLESRRRRRNYFHRLCDYLDSTTELQLLPYRDDIRFLKNCAEDYTRYESISSRT